MESDAIPSSEPETGGAQPEGIAQFARVVVDRPKGIGSHLSGQKPKPFSGQRRRPSVDTVTQI